MRLSALALFALASIAAPVPAQRADKHSDDVKKLIVADQPKVLLRNVRLVDVAGGTVREGQSILIENGRITGVGPALQAPAGAKIIDGQGGTAVPGLVLMHEHLFSTVPVGKQVGFMANPYIPQVMLAYGVTTARTAGSFDLAGDLMLKRFIGQGRAAGPDLDVTLFVGGPRPMYTLNTLTDAAGARREVAYWADRGATSIKLFFPTTPEVARGAMDEAKARRMSIAGHLCATHVATATKHGLETLEHGLWAAYDLVPEAKEGVCDTSMLQVAMFKRLAEAGQNDSQVSALLDLLLANGVAITPTLSVQAMHLCSPMTPPALREKLLLSRPEVIEPLAPCFPGLTAAMEKRASRFLAAAAKRYHEMGGTLLVGTDQGKVPGATAPEELEAMVAAGLKPLDVLKMATLNGARALRRDGEIGSIEVGKRADLLLVDGRPDEDISAMRRIKMVLKDGIGYDPEKLRGDAKGTILN